MKSVIFFVLCVAAVLRAQTTIAGSVFFAGSKHPGPPAMVVKAGANLQAVLDKANPGDTIMLEAGATFVGNFKLPNKDGALPVTLTSSAADKLPPGVRVKPSDARNMARIFSPNVGPAITTASGAHHWRIIGIEAASPGYYSGGVIRLGSGTETAIDQLPHDITIERSYIHGDPAKGSKRGIAPNGSHITIIDSYISDHKSDSQDAQAISCWNCDNLRVENNYLEGSGENIFIAELGTIKDYIPHDIVITRNWIRKPLSWLDGTDAGPTGKKWVVKNLFELKAGKNVKFTGNILENCWVSGQIGTMINLKPGIAGPVNASRTEDVLIENNLLSGGLLGICISGADARTAYPVGTGYLKNVTIRNNVLINLGGPPWGGPARLFQFVMSPSENIRIENNTVVGPNVATALVLDSVPSPGFVFRNNLVTHGKYGAKGPGQATGNTSLKIAMPDATWEGNVFINDKDLSKQYPGGTRFVTSVAFGEDGYSHKDLPGVGADTAKLKAAIAGVR